MIKLLLLYGADVHAPCGLRSCALFLAVEKLSYSLVRMLIDEYNAKADVLRTVSNAYDQRKSILHLIAETRRSDGGDLVDVMIQHGANVNATDGLGNTPLHQAYFNIEVVKKLLERGARVDKVNKSGETPLARFTRYRDREAVELLGGTYKKTWWKR
jgi:ankyrin repeat protein